MNKPADDFDAIVVGSGHSGLVSAWYLSRAGLKVLVLEALDRVGGTNVTEEVFPGYSGSSVSNVSHSLDPHVASDMKLREFGLRTVEQSLSHFTLFANGKRFVTWQEREAREEEIKALAVSDRDLPGFAEVPEFYRRVAQKMDVSFYDDAPSLDQVAAKFTTPREKSEFQKVIFGSVMDVLDDYLDSPELKAFLAGTSVATNMVGPWTPGSGLTLLMRPLYEASMRRFGRVERNDLMIKNSTPIGGVGAVTGAMAESARARGVRYLLNAPVTQILVKDGSAAGVVLADGSTYHAKTIVSNANPQTTFASLIDPAVLDPDFLERIHAIKMSGSSAKVHLALNGTPQFRAARSGYENELFVKAHFRTLPTTEDMHQGYALAQTGRWAARPSLAAVISSAADPSLTPPGCHFVSISVRGIPYHLAEGSWRDPAKREALITDVVDTFGEHVTNLSDILEGTHAYTPLDLEEKFGMAEGNGAHGDIVPSRFFDARPLPELAGYRTPVRGLYVCGVGVWPGNYMSGVTGFNASQRALDDLAGHPDLAVDEVVG